MVCSCWLFAPEPVILRPVIGGTASGLDRRSKPFFLFPELWGHGFKIRGLKDLADFDLVEAGALLRRRGYQVRRLEDGFPEWKVAGLPVESAPLA